MNISTLDVLDNPKNREILKESLKDYENTLKKIPASKWVDLHDLTSKLQRQAGCMVKIVNEKRFPTLNGNKALATKVGPRGFITVRINGKEFIAHVKSMIWI